VSAEQRGSDHTPVTKTIQRQATALQAADHHDTSLPQLPPTGLHVTVRGTFDRLAPSCCHDVPPGLTLLRTASVIQHLLSGTHFLGQFLIVRH